MPDSTLTGAVHLIVRWKLDPTNTRTRKLQLRLTLVAASFSSTQGESETLNDDWEGDVNMTLYMLTTSMVRDQR